MRAYNRPNGNGCRWDDCNRAAVGKSKYCATHRQAARTAFMAKVREAKAEKKARECEFEALLAEAEEKAGPPLAELASVVVKPGNTALARYLRADGWRKGKAGGVESPPFPSLTSAKVYARTIIEYGYKAEVCRAC